MKLPITLEQVNAILPNISRLRNNYYYIGQTGDVSPYASLLTSAVVYTENSGKTWKFFSVGSGDAVPEMFYKGTYVGQDFVHDFWDWMRGDINRDDIVHYICRVLKEEE